jgi:hypothetical protein
MDNERKEPVDLGKPSSNQPFENNQPYGQDPYNRQAFSNSDPGGVAPVKHSGLGIASFILALVAIVLIIVTVALGSTFINEIANDEAAQEKWAQIDPEDQEAVMEMLQESGFASLIVAGLTLIGAFGIAFIGLILGIIGVFSKNRRKVFSVTGLVLNSLMVVAPIILFFIGIAQAVSSAG